MFNEPCVHQSLYTDAVAIIAADSIEQALELLAASEEGWLLDELRRLPPRVIALCIPVVAFTDIRSE